MFDARLHIFDVHAFFSKNLQKRKKNLMHELYEKT